MYGPVRTVVWQGSAGDRGPYADLTGNPNLGLLRVKLTKNAHLGQVALYSLPTYRPSDLARTRQD